MPVERKRARRFRPEQALILGMLGDGLRHALTADVLIDADDAVAGAHDDVQIVRDEQNAATAARADRADQLVEIGLAEIVDAAHGFIEHEEIGLPQQRARQQHALKFTARQARQLPFRQPARADLFQNRLDFGVGHAGAQHEEAAGGQRDRRIQIEFLWSITDAQGGMPDDLPLVGFSSPSNTRASVVLPAPFGPISVTISPARTSMATSCKIVRPPLTISTPSADTRGSAGERAALTAWSMTMADADCRGRLVMLSSA